MSVDAACRRAASTSTSGLIRRPRQRRTQRSVFKVRRSLKGRDRHAWHGRFSQEFGQLGQRGKGLALAGVWVFQRRPPTAGGFGGVPQTQEERTVGILRTTRASAQAERWHNQVSRQEQNSEGVDRSARYPSYQFLTKCIINVDQAHPSLVQNQGTFSGATRCGS